MTVEQSNIQESVSRVRKKRKLVLVGIILLILIGKNIYEHSMAGMTEFVRSQMEKAYDFKGGYEIKEGKRVGKETVFKIVTTDKQQIEFEAKVVWGKLTLPWGELPILFRYCYDDFKDNVETYIMGEEAYNITDKSVEEVYDYMIEKRNKAYGLANHYNMTFEPQLIFKFRHGEKIFETGFINSKDLLEEFIEENDLSE